MKFPLCIIPAAGKGSRMGSLTADGTPKCLLPVNGLPMIVHVVNFWSAYADAFLVVTAPGREGAIRASIRARLDVDVNCIAQLAPLGTPNAVYCALNTYKWCPKRFIVALGDCLFDGTFPVDPREDPEPLWKCAVAVRQDDSDLARSYAVDPKGGPMVEKPLTGLGAYFLTWYALGAFRSHAVHESITSVMERLRVTEGVELRRFEGRYLNCTRPEDLGRWQ